MKGFSSYVQHLTSGRYRAEVYEFGHLVDTAEFHSEAAALRWLRKVRVEHETQPILNLHADTPQTLGMEF